MLHFFISLLKIWDFNFSYISITFKITLQVKRRNLEQSTYKILNYIVIYWMFMSNYLHIFILADALMHYT